MARKADFWLGMAVGAAAGTAGALFYAPKKGEELRHDMRNSVQENGKKACVFWGDVKERCVDMGNGAVQATCRVADQGRSVVGSFRSRMTEAVKVGQEAAEEKREELQTHFEEEKKAKASKKRSCPSRVQQ